MKSGEGIRVGIESLATELKSSFSGITYEGGSIQWQGNNFKLETVMDDGNGHFESGFLNAHLNLDTKYNLDGSSTITVMSVTFDSWYSELYRTNQAVAKNHTFNYTDPNGTPIFSKVSDGMQAYSTIPINRTYNIGRTVTLRPGEVSNAILIAMDLPQWIEKSRGYVYATLSYNPSIKIPTLPPIPNYEPTTTIKPRIPKVPTYKDLPEAPEVPTVSYNYITYNVQSDILKEVKNIEDIDIDKGLVNKLAEVKFELKTENLPAGREITNKFIIIDNLPTGYEVDLEKTKEASSSFDVVYTKDNHTIVFTALTETLNKLNQDLTKEIEAPFPTVIGKVLNDGAIYKNNFKLEINDYEKYSNTVTISTPGNPNDPDNPTNNLIKPTKENTNKDGVNIDGKTLLPGSINYYKLLWDLDQYKGIKASKEDIAKGFFYIDDYPEEALELNENGITLVDAKGQAVKGVKVEAFESVEKATEEVKDMLAKAKIAPKGAFQVFTATDSEQFFKDYVVTGNSITITNPMVVKKAFSGEYENKAFQIDFGNGYETETVVNNIPKLESKKDVVIDVTNKDNSLDGKEIELGKVRSYNLVGSKLPANRGEEITQYGFYDDYDQTGDQYDGVYLAFATVDVTLKDGTVIKKGTEITKYTTQNVDTKNGKVSIELDKVFLEKVSLDSEFQADVFLQFKRISAGTFKNTFINTVNGFETTSNTVETHTTEPKKPEPKKPTPPSPEKTKKVLPKTSAAAGKEQNNNAGALASGLVTLGVLTLVRKRKVQ